MKHYHMNFEVQSISVYTTEYYDNPQAAIDEASYYFEEILDRLSGHSDSFYYDGDENDDQELNDAIALFRSWIQTITSLLPNLEEHGLVSVDDEVHNITVYLWCNETKIRFVPREKMEAA